MSILGILRKGSMRVRREVTPERVEFVKREARVAGHAALVGGKAAVHGGVVAFRAGNKAVTPARARRLERWLSTPLIHLPKKKKHKKKRGWF